MPGSGPRSEDADLGDHDALQRFQTEPCGDVMSSAEPHGGLDDDERLAWRAGRHVPRRRDAQIANLERLQRGLRPGRVQFFVGGYLDFGSQRERPGAQFRRECLRGRVPCIGLVEIRTEPGLGFGDRGGGEVVEGRQKTAADGILIRIGRPIPRKCDVERRPEPLALHLNRRCLSRGRTDPCDCRSSPFRVGLIVSPAASRRTVRRAFFCSLVSSWA